MIKEILSKTLIGIISAIFVFCAIIGLIFLLLKFGVPYAIENFIPDWMKQIKDVIP